MRIRVGRFIFPLLFVGGFSFAAIAQEQETLKKPHNPQPYSLVLKTNPLPVLWGPVLLTSEFRLVNEFVVAPNQSSEIGISFLGKSPVFTIFDNFIIQNNRLKILVRGFRFQLSHKLYLNELRGTGMYAPEGLYIGPLFSYSTARFTDRYLNRYNIYIRSTHVNLNLIVGSQRILSEDFTLDFFCGMGYKKNTWIEHTPPTSTIIQIQRNGSYYSSNFKVILGFNIGKAF